MRSLPTSCFKSITFVTSWNFHVYFNWITDLDHSQVYGEASFSLLELRAYPGFSPPTVGPTSFIPLSMARCSFSSARFLFNSGWCSFLASLARLLAQLFISRVASLLCSLDTLRINSSCNWLASHSHRILHLMALLSGLIAILSKCT